MLLTVNEDYELGTKVIPKLPDNYEQMNTNDKEEAVEKYRDHMLAKGYELSAGLRNDRAYKALQMPRFLRELFIRCGEASVEGIVPLRACLIDVCNNWHEMDFVGDYTFSFTEQDLQNHAQDFDKYRNFHKVQELAKALLNTDSEGWISPQLDFSMKQEQNQTLLDLFMLNSAEYNMSPEEIRGIYPYIER